MKITCFAFVAGAVGDLAPGCHPVGGDAVGDLAPGCHPVAGAECGGGLSTGAVSLFAPR